MVICLERGADLHMAQLMSLPLTVSCFSKIQIGFTFLVPAHLGSPGKKAVKRVCVCVCYYYSFGYTTELCGVEDGVVNTIENQSINQSCIFRVVQVIKSLQNPLEVGNSLPGINDNVREQGQKQKCF